MLKERVCVEMSIICPTRQGTGYKLQGGGGLRSGTIAGIFFLFVAPPPLETGLNFSCPQFKIL